VRRHGYYEVDNRDHVFLIDLTEEPIERLTARASSPAAPGMNST
jgi:hypothetical protein